MPACSNELQHEAHFGEVCSMASFPELVGCETVAVCRERLHDGFKGVGLVEPAFGVQVVLHGFDLPFEGFWDKEVSAVVDVFDKTAGVEYA